MSTTDTTTGPGSEGPGAARDGAPRGLVHGLNWLVLRQHRTAFLCLLAVVVLGSAWIAYQRAGLVAALDDARRTGDVGRAVGTGQRFNDLDSLLTGLPLLLAVFLGAPLLAADLEQGTARLVTTQSVRRGRWTAAKLTWALGAALVAGGVLGAVHTWWWQPYREVFPHLWMEDSYFDTTGPVLAALCLFLTAAGIAIGALVRRMLPAMALTFVFSWVALAVWDRLRVHLGSSQTLTYPLNGERPARLDSAHEVESWLGSADGTLHGWGSCAEQTQRATDACMKEKGIVEHVVEYLDPGQLAPMQWAGAGVLTLAAALCVAAALWLSARRPL